jgi:hypothetical protein
MQGTEHMTFHYINIYEITNLHDLECQCQFLKVTGLPPDSSFDKNLNVLVKKLAYDLRQPVALVNRSGDHYIVIPIESPVPALEQSLTPHIATLVPIEKKANVQFDALNQETLPIGLSFLRYAVKGALMGNHSLWSFGNSYYVKAPINAGNNRDLVDIFGGFKCRIVPLESKRLFLCVDLAYKYVERDWLTAHLTEQTLDPFRMRHFLYCFGDQFYEVQLLVGTGLSIKDEKFQLDPYHPPVDVFSYTKEKWGDKHIPYIDTLDPHSPAILYKYPGSERQAHGAAALCRLVLPTEDTRVKALHSRSIRSPTSRFREIERIIERNFQNLRLGNNQVLVSTYTYRGDTRYFAVPDQLVGHGKTVHVRRNGSSIGITLSALGQTRMKYLRTPEIGPLSTSAFDAQYILLPLTLNRDIAEDFCTKIEQSIQEIYPCRYDATPVFYDDRDARTLERQAQAILSAIAENEISHGYALLILPSRGESDLHNYIKKHLWPDIQCQCASADSIASFYENGQSGWVVNEESRRRYSSYLRYLALGVLIVNRKWISALSEPLKYDVYVGIDVLNRMAGFTYVYLGGKKAYFRSYPTQQKEKLSARNLRKVLRDDLERDIHDLGITPKHIIVHRDGRSFSTEIRGLHEAIRSLKGEGVVVPDALVGVVEIHKQSAYPLRMAEGIGLDSLGNPQVGSWFRLSDEEGIVCNTGTPFLTQGTAKPLHVRIADGNLEIEKVLEDVFALSNLTWSAPDKCQRLPITTKLGDTFLRPIASPADVEKALYGEEEAGDEEAEEVEAGEKLEEVEQSIGVDQV